MNYLKAINKSHLLVVVFFENTEQDSLRRISVSELNKYGIQTVLTSPKDLTIDTINKYLEIKAKGLL